MVVPKLLLDILGCLSTELWDLLVRLDLLQVVWSVFVVELGDLVLWSQTLGNDMYSSAVWFLGLSRGIGPCIW